MKPMCAYRYADKRRHVKFPCHVQPKLNGVRALYCDGVLQSRYEEIWSDAMFMPLRDDLRFIGPNVLLDGEFYVHGWSLQQINSACAVKRVAPSPKTMHVQYHIFDCVFLNDPELSFEARWSALTALMLPYSALSFSLVSTIKVHDEATADGLFSQFKKLDYEGMMYRYSDAPYGLVGQCSNQENRWLQLLKRKDFLDEEFTCLDVELGKGKYESMVGALVFATPEGRTFTAGSGLSDAQRHRYLDKPPIGCKVRIKYEMLSDERIPLKPTIEIVFEDTDA